MTKPDKFRVNIILDPLMHLLEMSKFRASKLRKVPFSLSLRSYNNYLLAVSLFPITYVSIPPLQQASS